MAVYTRISRAQLLDFLEDYDLGTLESFEGIKKGVENTNYHVWTDRGHYILTLFENRVDPKDLPFFFAFTDHLNDEGIRCPRAQADLNGNIIGMLEDRSAVFSSFLEGHDLAAADIRADHCAQVGDLAACMHEAARSFEGKRPNGMGLPAWKDLAKKTKARADEAEAGLAGLIAEELAFLEKNWPKKLPKAAIHADIFPDNVFFRKDDLFGVIDFYFSCTDFLAYDRALAINAWCFDAKNQFKPARFGALMDSYQAVRELEPAEKEALPLLCRGAAMRILMTRLHDWLFHDPESFVKPHDPREYLAKLKFHQSNQDVIPTGAP